MKLFARYLQRFAMFFALGIPCILAAEDEEQATVRKAIYGSPFSHRDLSGVVPVKFPGNLMAIPNLRRFVTGYIMNLQVPWRGRMQIYSAWGGSDMPITRWMKEVIAMKYTFPDDLAMDYVWRCAVGENYETIRELQPGSHEFSGDELIQALLFGQDYDSKVGLDEQLLSLELVYSLGENYYPVTWEFRSDNGDSACDLLLYDRRQFPKEFDEAYGINTIPKDRINLPAGAPLLRVRVLPSGDSKGSFVTWPVVRFHKSDDTFQFGTRGALAIKHEPEEGDAPILSLSMEYAEPLKSTEYQHRNHAETSAKPIL